MQNTVYLGSKKIVSKRRPYIIAEIGVNHEGSLDQAKRLIDLAKKGGANAVKFQSYKAQTLASKYSPSYWDLGKENTTSQYDLFKKYDSFDSEDYIKLAEYCIKNEIDFLSTPFDDDAIEFLDPLIPFYKIASADITNVPFLRKIASKGKPIVLSTGASTLGEIDLAVDVITRSGCDDLALLHCVLNYPTENKNAHLGMIKGLRQAYPKHIIGYSDHTLPDEAMTSLVSAYLLGSMILEKHFTHDKNLPGNDHYHAMDYKDLMRLVMMLERVNELLGGEEFKAPIPSENVSRENARRSIVIASDIPAGKKLSENDLTYKRPGNGISPTHWDDVINKCVNKDLKQDHILRWSDILS